MKTIITFLFVFGLIVVVHEFGHFIFAKRSGILVREFSIGMGPKLFSHRKNGTTYTIRILPLGGYVRMAGAEEEEEITPGTPLSIELNTDNEVVKINTSHKVQLPNSIPMEVIEVDLVDDLFIKGYENGNEDREVRYAVQHDATIIEEDGVEVQIAPKDVQFQSAKLHRRMLTNFAGPMNNFILTFVLFVLVAFLQGGIPTPDTSSIIGNVQKDSVADKAGLRPEDKIIEMDGKKIATFDEMTEIVKKSENKEITVVVQRGKKTKELKMTPKKSDVGDGTKKVVIGVNANVIMEKGSFFDKIKYAAQLTYQNAIGIFVALKGLITGFSLNKLGGPVMIYKLSSEVAQAGILPILRFTAMLSVNLGIVNLLPIPALDGGKLILNMIEGVRGKPLSVEKEGMITLVGFAIMMILMVLVTWNDIRRFFL